MGSPATEEEEKEVVMCAGGDVSGSCGFVRAAERRGSERRRPASLEMDLVSVCEDIVCIMTTPAAPKLVICWKHDCHTGSAQAPSRALGTLKTVSAEETALKIPASEIPAFQN